MNSDNDVTAQAGRSRTLLELLTVRSLTEKTTTIGTSFATWKVELAQIDNAK